MRAYTIYREYSEALRSGDRNRALSVVQTALDNGTDIRDLYIAIFQPAMQEVGLLWETGQVTVAEEHMATSITMGVMNLLQVRAIAPPPIGRSLVATCVGGELHDLGLRMVADFFALEGWTVYYLGANTPVDDVVWLVNQRKPDLLAVSATMITHVLNARELIQAVRASSHGDQIKIMVGGGPSTMWRTFIPPSALISPLTMRVKRSSALCRN